MGMDVRIRHQGAGPTPSLQTLANRAVARAYGCASNPLRASMVLDPLGSRRNIRDNTPAILQVDLVEIDPHWRVYGAGITLSGPTLRALADVGVIDAVMREGWCADGVDLCTPLGEKLAELPTPRVGRPDVPAKDGGALTNSPNTIWVNPSSMKKILSGRIA